MALLKNISKLGILAELEKLSYYFSQLFLFVQQNEK